MPRDGRPVDPELRARVLELVAEGKGRNEIAREVGLGAATITAIAPEGSFDRSASAKAVRARQVDMAEQRAEVAAEFLRQAKWALGRMRKPGERVAGNGDRVRLSRPDAGDVRNWMLSAGSAMKSHIDLVKFDSDQGQARAESLLDAIAAGIGAAAEILHGEPAEEESADG